jgi:hypothetical protein
VACPVRPVIQPPRPSLPPSSPSDVRTAVRIHTGFREASLETRKDLRRRQLRVTNGRRSRPSERVAAVAARVILRFYGQATSCLVI